MVTVPLQSLKVQCAVVSWYILKTDRSGKSLLNSVGGIGSVGLRVAWEARVLVFLVGMGQILVRLT